MIGNPSSEMVESLPKNTDIESSKNISNTNLNASTVPMNSSIETNNTAFSQNSITTNQAQKEEEGVFSRMFNYIKNNWNPWKIEEEEYIDAHGFKAKRPKTKIPLRKKGDDYNSDIQKAGGVSMAYATQHTGFGNLFL